MKRQKPGNGARLVAALILALSLTLAAAQPAAAALDFDAVDAHVQAFMQEHRVPGVAIAITQDDQVVHLGGFGTAGVSNGPVTPQTPFIIGSTSKSFTALAVMQLVEAGQIDLDARVQEYLPWFQVGDDPAAAAITVRHLLNHTSGIPTLAGEDTLSVNDSSPDALERQVRRLNRQSLSHTPGSAFEYANANYQTAGLIVQTVSGVSFEDYVQEHIFDPLQMSHSYTSKIEAQAGGLAAGYHYWFGFPVPAGRTPYPRQHFPSGFYISCAEDLAHALIAHLNDGEYQGASLISPAGMAQLHQPVLDDYAMGWAGSGPLQWHDGSVADYGSQIFIDRQRHLGIAVLFNINNAVGASRLYRLAPDIWRLLIGLQPDPAPPETQYWTLAIMLIAILVAAVIWLRVSWRMLARWRKEPASRPRGLRRGALLGLPLLVELALAVYLWRQLTAGLLNGLLYQPDLTILLLADVALLVGWGAVRTILGARLLWGKARVGGSSGSVQTN